MIRRGRALFFALSLCSIHLRISGTAWGGYPPVDPENAIRGYWEQPYNWVTAAIHMVVLKGTDSNSEIVYWAAGPEARMWKFNPGDTLGPDAALFSVPSLNSNIFCGGNSVLATGELLTTGGTEFSDQGLDHVNRFVPGSGWVTPRPRNMVENRYYPTNTALSDGTVLVAGGRQFQEMVIFGGETALNEKSNGIMVLGMRGAAPVVAAQPTGPFPPARTGHSVVFDDGSNQQSAVGYRYLQRPVIFGGADASGTLLSDVWVLYRDELANWSWDQLNPDPDPVWGAPSARRNHAAVFDKADSSMIVISGEEAPGSPVNDVWKLFLYKGAEGKWARQFPSGSGPFGLRYGHTAVLDAANRRVLIFGGRNVTLSSTSVHVLSLAGSPSWSLLTTTGTAPAQREGHAAVYDTKWGKNRMILFGGNNDASRFNDLHALDFLQPVPEWSPLNPNPDPGNGIPSPRTNMSMIHDTEWDRLVIIGGDENGAAAGGIVGDAWHVTLEPPGTLKPDVVHPRHPEPPPVGTVESNWSRLYQNLFGDGLTEASAVFDSRWLNSAQPELFFPDQDFWLPLYSARMWQPLYPFHFLLPSGKVFFAGPSYQTYILNVDQAAWESYPWSFNPVLGGSAVQYLPGKIMKCGYQGVTGTRETAVIDLSGSEASAQWINLTAGSKMIPRVEHNLTMLPNGKVLLTGGLRDRLDIGTAVRRPQIWDPETMVWGDSTLLALEPAKRDYHSSINLLPDGRLLSGGGELRSFPQDYDRFTATIYWPPYLFDGTGALAARPEIASSPPEMIYDGYMIVETPQAATITSVCLIRPGATTHAFNQDQRYVPLDFTYPGGDGLIVHVPENPNLLPTGNYFLFILSQDVPSVAKWIKIGANVTGTNTGPPPPRPDLSAFPNPFSDATALEFVLDRRSDVKLEIFDAAGRRIRVLDEGERDAGQYRLAWAGRDDFGRPVAGGVYFARLRAGSRLSTAKLIVDRNGR